jgi:hypothetical protein
MCWQVPSFAAFSAGVLEQVIRHGVPLGPSHPGPGRNQRGGGAVQLDGGVGQGLLEPVLRRFGLLLGGAITRRRGAQLWLINPIAGIHA